MKKSTLILMGLVVVIFALSWIFKAMSFKGVEEHYILQGFLVTFAAFLTLSIMSFLYRDNPFYKFAEHLFVGISAAFWMSMGFWSTIVGNLIPRLSEGLSSFFKVHYIPGDYNFFFYIPVVLGILLLILGVQFIFFGLMGELIVFSSQKETSYTVKDQLG